MQVGDKKSDDFAAGEQILNAIQPRARPGSSDPRGMDLALPVRVRRPGAILRRETNLDRETGTA